MRFDSSTVMYEPFRPYLGSGRILNLGSGNIYINGWVNADLYNDDVDIRFDFRNTWPLKDCEFDAIYCAHVLEHFDWDEVCHILREASRVLKPRGAFCIRVPHLSNYEAFLPFHKTFWCENAFDRLSGIGYNDPKSLFRYQLNQGQQIPVWDVGPISVRTVDGINHGNSEWNKTVEMFAVMLKC